MRRALPLASAFLTVALLTNAVAGGPAPAARDRVYTVGASGWTLERFGSDLVILRARIANVPALRDAAGSLLLTCQGPERRLLIELPQPLPGVAGGTMPARLLVTQTRAVPDGGFPADISIENGRRAILSDGSRQPGASAVLLFSRLLRRRPDRLNLLLSFGPRANLARDIPIHLLFTFGPREAVVLDDVASTCDPNRAGPGSAHEQRSGQR